MTENSYPRDWLRTLSTEAGRWVRDGLITEAQRESIQGLYPAESAGGRDRTVLIISILGSVLLGAGVILFFAANWPRIPATVKVASILVAIVGTYGTGYYLQFVRDDYPRIGHSLIFLGGLFYGAGIWLIAQIFHFASHYPNGFLLWGLGLLPVIWAASSRPMLYLATGVLGVWTVMEQAEFATYNPLFPVLVIGLVIPFARRLQTVLAEAAALAGLFLWFGLNVGSHDLEPMPHHGAVIIGRALLLYGSAILSLGFARLGDQRAYLSVGSLAALGGAYVLSFNSGPADIAVPAFFTGSAFLIIGLSVMLAVTLAGAYLIWRGTEADRLPLTLVLAIIIVAALGANLLPLVPRMIGFNVLLFVGTVGLVVFGTRRRSELLINLGLLSFVVHTFTRYVDIFFTAMDKSLFFMLGGVLLLGGGWLLERNRRRWIGEWGGGAR